MTLDEIQDLINNKVDFTIICETIEQRFDATQALLDMGIAHGNSGYSKDVVRGSDDRRYMHPYVNYHHGYQPPIIGYFGPSSGVGERIPFAEIVWLDPIETDTFDNDLLDMLTK